ncbi:GNAT family N-acetyltransferase [Erysipelothrix enhydrae]|uniref:GNAT family N-acetyltransferase n=1 Tax=Erysipelothrix enhydrae TaxID=2890314 RepID=UPI002B24DE21|nr:GNAT family N-acetyltransferase [Erysipelothrix sp. 4322-04]WRB86747.1 GNAT family N-acetyltransferase [Erysipelothrix sp. 4322-04]
MNKVSIDDFNESGYQMDQEDEFFEAMNDERDNKVFAFKEDEKLIAFIMFRVETFTNWFFREEVVFVRELCVKKPYRKIGLASKLLVEVEGYVRRSQIYKLILTTETAAHLYLKNCYTHDRSYTAKNKHSASIKNLSVE